MPDDASTIRHGWESYAAAVIPLEAERTQRIESRRCFYAGAWYLLQILNRVAEDDISEDAGVRILERITGEIEEFYRHVRRGEDI